MIKGNFKNIIEPYWSAAFCTIVNIIGGLIPLWLGAILLKALSKWTNWSIFYENGEFYIYTATFLTTSIYLIYLNKKKGNYLHMLIFFVSMFCLVISAALFSLVLEVNKIISDPIIKLNPMFLKNTSIGMFILSIIIYFISQAMNNKSAPDLHEMEKNDILKLDSQLSGLR